MEEAAEAAEAAGPYDEAILETLTQSPDPPHLTRKEWNSVETDDGDGYCSPPSFHPSTNEAFEEIILCKSVNGGPASRKGGDSVPETPTQTIHMTKRTWIR